MSIWFVLMWLAIGTAVGIFAAALLGAANRASDEEEQSYEEQWQAPHTIRPGGANWAQFLESRSIEFETKDDE